MKRLPEASRDGGFELSPRARHPKEIALGPILPVRADAGGSYVDIDDAVSKLGLTQKDNACTKAFAQKASKRLEKL